jgi:hypothetical protein
MKFLSKFILMIIFLMVGFGEVSGMQVYNQQGQPVYASASTPTYVLVNGQLVSVQQAQTVETPAQQPVPYKPQQAQTPTGFEAYELNARRIFESQTLPAIRERFTAMGGGQRSSTFEGAIAQARAEFESQLAQMRKQYYLQQQQAFAAGVPQVTQLAPSEFDPIAAKARYNGIYS